MNILFLSWNDPRLHDSGSKQRSHLIYRTLCELGPTYAALPAMAGKTELLDDPRIARVAAEHQYSPRWMARNLTMRAIPEIILPRSSEPAWPADWPSFDLAVVRYPTLASYWQPWKWAPTLLDLDDLPSDLLETRATGFRGAFANRLVRSWQTAVCQHCAHIWLTYPEQADTLPSSIPTDILENIPFASETAIYDESDPQCPYLFTVGVLSHPPNYHGLRRFIREIWPALHAACPDLRWRIAGRDCPPALVEECAGTPGVELLGFAPDLAPLYRNALACIVPVATGAGTCIKVREALLWGRACLGWPFAFRGIPLADQLPVNGIFPCDTPDDFVAAIRHLSIPSDRRPIQQAARTYALGHWSPARFSSVIRASVASLRLQP
jgi:hypothetical protein